MNRNSIAPIADIKKAVRNNLDKCMDKFHKHGKKIFMRKGESLGNEQIFLLLSGKCALRLKDPRGGTITILYHVPGQLISFMPLLAKCLPFDEATLKGKIPSSMFNVKVLCDSELIQLENDWFMSELPHDPDISLYLLYSCAFNLIKVYAKTYNSPMLSNSQRMCRLILSAIGDDPDRVIPGYLTHAEISNHLSIHAITVSKILGRLKSMGIIEKVNGNMVVANPEALKAIADGFDKISY